MESLMADFKAQHEALHTKIARLTVELAEVRTENETLRTKCTQLEQVDNLALHAVLNRLHSGLRAQLNSDTTYTACLQNLADSQETRLQLKREVQQLQSALEVEKSAANSAAARVEIDQRRCAADYAASEMKIRQEHGDSIQTLKDNALAAQRASEIAADELFTQLVMTRSENVTMAAALDKERVAFAANVANRSEAVWKGRMIIVKREMKKELDRVNTELALIKAEMHRRASNGQP